MARFWAKVRKTDTCWMWTGTTTSGGYGIFRPEGVKGRAVGAHRFIYEKEKGPIPDELLVCHSCDINYPVGDTSYRRCVRVDHLWLGTVGDNNLDRHLKGRDATGERNGIYQELAKHLRETRKAKGKLTWEMATSIRERYATGIAAHQMVTDYPVGRRAILDVIHGRTWTREF